MAGIRRGYVAPTGTDYAAAIPRAAHRDLSFVELFVEGPNDRERLAEEASEVATLANVYGLGLVAHLPTGLDLGSPHEHVQDGALLELEAALDVAETVGATRAVLRPKPVYGRAPPDVEARRDRLLSSIRALDDYASQRGIRLSVRVPQASLDLREGLARLFEETEVDACLDTGLAALAGHGETDQATLLLERSDRIAHLHLRDVRTPWEGAAPRSDRPAVDWSLDVDPIGAGGDPGRADGDPGRAGSDGGHRAEDHSRSGGHSVTDGRHGPDGGSGGKGRVADARGEDRHHRRSDGGSPDPRRPGPRESEPGSAEPSFPDEESGVGVPGGDHPDRGTGTPVAGLPFGAGDVDFDRLLDPVRLGWSGTVSLAVGTDDEGYLDESVRRLDEVL